MKGRIVKISASISVILGIILSVLGTLQMTGVVGQQTPSSAISVPVEAPVVASTELPITTQETVPDPVTETPTPSEEPANWMEALLPSIDPSGLGHWIFERNGSWGATDSNKNVYIDPDTPTDKRYSVMIHEMGHVLQDQQYGSLAGARAALGDIESAADCYALSHGASWLNYGCG